MIVLTLTNVLLQFISMAHPCQQCQRLFQSGKVRNITQLWGGFGFKKRLLFEVFGDIGLVFCVVFGKVGFTILAGQEVEV